MLDALLVGVGEVDVLDLHADDADRAAVDRRRDGAGEVGVERRALLNCAHGIVLTEDRLDPGGEPRVDEPKNGHLEIAVLRVDLARIRDDVRDADREIGRLLVARIGVEILVALRLGLNGDLAHRVDPRKLEVEPSTVLADELAEPQHDGALALVDLIPGTEGQISDHETDEHRQSQTEHAARARRRVIDFPHGFSPLCSLVTRP